MAKKPSSYMALMSRGPFDKRLLVQQRFLAQEYLAGASISVCFCTTRDGKLATSYATEKVHHGIMRTGSRVATVDRPDAIDLASRFVLLTGFVGFGELEMLDSESGPVLLELNARPWSQVQMSDTLGAPILEMAVRLMSGQHLPESVENVTQKVEWVRWDVDLLFRRKMRQAGQSVRPRSAGRRIHALGFFRDPLPALTYAWALSPLGPKQLLPKIARLARRRLRQYGALARLGPANATRLLFENLVGLLQHQLGSRLARSTFRPQASS